MGEHRRYPTEKQVLAAAKLAKAVGISRIGAMSVSPDGTIRFLDASLARRFATEADDGAEALSQLEAQIGAS